MNIEGSSPISIPYAVAKAEKTEWIRIWHELPKEGQIVPVWDGDYIYYAVYWDRDNKQLWIITDQIGINLNDIHKRKSTGDQVFPLQWMKIMEPNE